MKLRDKVVLVTGSSRGIGRETARALSSKKAKVVVTYFKDRKEGLEVYDEIRKKTDALLIRLDVGSDSSIRKAIGRIRKRFGRLDVLVNNAGVVSWNSFREESNESIDRMVDVNLKGPIKMARAALPLLEKARKPVIVNVASRAGKNAYEDLTVYSATKFGLRGFSKSLAKELDGFEVYCANPGRTKTRMTDYSGAEPRNVASVIVATIEGRIEKKSGDEIDVWKYLN